MCYACSCNKTLNFVKGAKIADKVILGRIIKREFKVDDGTKLYDNDKLEKYFIKNKGKVFHYVEILTVEVIETIRGKKEGTTIEIYGGNFDSCWSSLNYLKTNESYIISLFETINPLEFDKPIENSFGYELGACQTSSLSINSNLDEVTGIIRKKKKTISYEKLKRKIT
jgi:hypothetical protein